MAKPIFDGCDHKFTPVRGWNDVESLLENSAKISTLSWSLRGSKTLMEIGVQSIYMETTTDFPLVCQLHRLKKPELDTDRVLFPTTGLFEDSKILMGNECS